MFFVRSVFCDVRHSVIVVPALSSRKEEFLRGHPKASVDVGKFFRLSLRLAIFEMLIFFGRLGREDVRED